MSFDNLVIDVSRDDAPLLKRQMMRAVKAPPTVKATGANSSSRELIEARLSDPTTPDSEREYLQDLLRRKYS
jgi:hypothetical protein